MTETWALSGDLARTWIVAAVAVAAGSLLLLAVELWFGRRDARAGAGVALSGLCALALMLAAVLRPVRVSERATTIGARVLVLADASRSIDLPGDDGQPRRKALTAALSALDAHLAGVRVRLLAFGRGPGQPFDGPAFAVPPVMGSDLVAALEQVARGTDELPQAIVVLSDGRLDRPSEQGLRAELHAAMGDLAIPIHTVAVASREPVDASIRSAHLSGAVVAHQAASLHVEVGCSGGLSCTDVPIAVKELHTGEPAVLRASAVARVEGGKGQVDLDVTLDRAGSRILEVSLSPPEGDTIPEDDRRFIAVEVGRDRVRLLHVAGRPTYDVRALRTWLKSDASVDVVAFFILRTHEDDVVAPQDELALIPFPVDELFTKHLPSFDAVILQDFDAEPYGLSVHLRRLADYVRQGGGLIMVGGPNAFVSGNYARTPLAEVLPVGLGGIKSEQAVDLASFAPRLTKAGRRAPVLAQATALIGDRWPEMPGTNVVGDARQGATVLLDHPSLRTASGASMPVLALGEYGSGRSIALTVDGTHLLQFSELAAETAGRAHGALWDALLGWLMRDPRFEPVSVELTAGGVDAGAGYCIAGVPAKLRLRAMFEGQDATARIDIARMDTGATVRDLRADLGTSDGTATVDLGALDAGGYTATVRLGSRGAAPAGAPTRYDFACEAGGDEWADPRPDRERLLAISKATGGVAVPAAEVGKIPQPRATKVVVERHERAVMPPWAFTLMAALAMGGHWLARRRSGLM